MNEVFTVRVVCLPSFTLVEQMHTITERLAVQDAANTTGVKGDVLKVFPVSGENTGWITRRC